MEVGGGKPGVYQNLLAIVMDDSPQDDLFFLRLCLDKPLLNFLLLGQLNSHSLLDMVEKDGLVEFLHRRVGSECGPHYREGGN